MQQIVSASPSSSEKAEPSSDEPQYINRELSWLEFNRRVLHEALDERTPLLERVGFLAIFSSNLDEFIMKRVGRLKRRVAHRVVSLSVDGRTPEQELDAIRESLLPMLKQASDSYRNDIHPALRSQGIHLLPWEELAPGQRQEANDYFREHVFSILTPLSVDPGHPFPFISNLSTSLGLLLRSPESGEQSFARVKIPEVLPKWVQLKTSDRPGEIHFVNLLSVIQQNIPSLFPGMEILESMAFRITRSADIGRGDEDDVEDIREMVEEEIRQRRFSAAVRLEIRSDPSPWILDFLLHELELSETDVYEVEGELDFTGLRTVAKLNIPNLRYPPWTPVVPHRLVDDQADIFTIIRNGDLLVHHPYESFAASVERFLKAAAEDPKVVAVKMTMYRTGDQSPFVPLLIKAAEAGKQVACLVELKARFDEERNIYWAQVLEKAGVHVVYGIVGLKTHMKSALVVRQENDGLRCYAHIGTGNYHAVTSNLYTDLGLFTCNPAITGELVELFNYITGISLKKDYRKLLIAPINMKKNFINMIGREVKNHKAGRPAHIVAKMNSLEDLDICRTLYYASQAGVPIDLIVRGFCCLRAGVPGLSDNIRVISIVGRFLEHSRLFYFRNGAEDPAEGDFFIGSADWMYRNLETRVEAIVPIEDKPLRTKLWNVLEICLADQRQAWDMQPDSSYVQRTPSSPEAAAGTQQKLVELSSQ